MSHRTCTVPYQTSSATNPAKTARLTTVRTPCRRPQRRSSVVASDDAASSLGSSSRVLVGTITTSVNGTSAPSASPPTSQAAQPLGGLLRVAEQRGPVHQHE